MLSKELILSNFESQKKHEQNDDKIKLISKTIHHHITGFLYFGCHELRQCVNNSPGSKQNPKNTPIPKKKEILHFCLDFHRNRKQNTEFKWFCLVVCNGIALENIYTRQNHRLIWIAGYWILDIENPKWVLYLVFHVHYIVYPSLCINYTCANSCHCCRQNRKVIRYIGAFDIIVSSCVSLSSFN